ncbi:hypothetical protein GCM10022206_55750 [Streptomyces chiangmaiensis]
MDIGSAFRADPEAARAAQPGEPALHDPTEGPWSTAVRCAAASEDAQKSTITHLVPQMSWS